MFIEISFIKRKIRGLSLRLFNTIENNGNTFFESNGEQAFIDNLFLYFKKNNKEKVVFDVGANVGNYSKMIQDKSIEYTVGVDLHLFEPTSSSFSVIESSFDVNKTTINKFGASNKNATARIFFDKAKSTLASLYQRNLDYYELKLEHSEEIVLRRLDEYIEEKEIVHIDFVKIDIEGHELRAFEGFGKYMSGEFIDFIQFEYGGANLDSHSSLMDIYEFLSKRGFEIAKVMPKGLEIRRYAPYMDNFQYSNYMAISKKVLE